MLISSNSITFEKCLVFNVRSGIFLATQMPAIRVSGMPMPSPLYLRMPVFVQKSLRLAGPKEG